MNIAIAGGGIGGLTLALALHQRGISCTVYEAAPQLRPLGVGVNLLPHSVKELTELGLQEALAATAIETASLTYYNKFGQTIWSEPRGIAAGYPVPQYSIHRGELHMILLDAVLRRLGPERVVLGHQLTGFVNSGQKVQATFTRLLDNSAVTVEADALVAADGIHSAARKQMWPDEGAPRYGQRVLWRAITEGEPFGDGRSMFMAGHPDVKFVAYPISRKLAEQGRSRINWIAELSVPEMPTRTDWNRQVDIGVFAAPFDSWNWEWIDIPKLIRGASAVYEFPLVDRDPLPHWRQGRVTLLGDAAHPMYPIGSNGASQAILDVRALADALAGKGQLDAALDAYEAERLPKTANIVLLNRQNGPEQVMAIAEQRAPEGFKHIHDVMPREELEGIAARYKQVAGFTKDQVKKA
ncbi:flavin-dependent oxidoreductase [Piscinibacter gummiphilus]|uniref:Flavin-dependent oxidoreductase n=1 Tax=Piscinibacter gummiphilus TaxID=946333 RepID=A0ABZ0CNH1_9BURK|nr:flavin-dependent oxidoreductase [Piscinibacter gummiphilus]WOB06398.1 flavin-dependent oxidoreductase [Piscinibacter gummiphilus]